MGFTKAVRERLTALIAMMGASGSGKTFSSLVLAKGMMLGKFPDLTEKDQELWDKIGVADTEHNRSKIYADMTKHGIYIGSFQHLNITKPFTHDKYIQAIQDAKAAGIEVLILDSTTHLWKELLAEQQNDGGRYQDWKEPTRKYEEFIDAFTQAGIHIIATMRSKQSYALESSETGKLEVAKLGEKPVQRDDFEYEFLLSFLFNQTHHAKAVKDNTPLFEELGQFQITEQHGKDLIEWLDKGKDVLSERKQEEAKKQAEVEKRQTLAKEAYSYTETDMENMNEYAKKMIAKVEAKTGKGQLHRMPTDRLEEMIKYLDQTYRKAQEKANEKEPEKKEEEPKEENQEPTEEQEKKTVAGLREVAKSFGIKGYTKMKKEELLKAIDEAQKKKETAETTA